MPAKRARSSSPKPKRRIMEKVGATRTTRVGTKQRLTMVKDRQTGRMKKAWRTIKHRVGSVEHKKTKKRIRQRSVSPKKRTYKKTMKK